MKIILSKQRGPDWVFLPIKYASGMTEGFYHKSRFGNLYGIFPNRDIEYPFFIMRFIDNRWLNWHHDIRPIEMELWDDNEKCVWYFFFEY